MTECHDIFCYDSLKDDFLTISHSSYFGISLNSNEDDQISNNGSWNQSELNKKNENSKAQTPPKSSKATIVSLLNCKKSTSFFKNFKDWQAHLIHYKHLKGCTSAPELTKQPFKLNTDKLNDSLSSDDIKSNEEEDDENEKKIVKPQPVLKPDINQDILKIFRYSFISSMNNRNNNKKLFIDCQFKADRISSSNEETSNHTTQAIKIQPNIINYMELKPYPILENRRRCESTRAIHIQNEAKRIIPGVICIKFDKNSGNSSLKRVLQSTQQRYRSTSSIEMSRVKSSMAVVPSRQTFNQPLRGSALKRTFKN